MRANEYTVARLREEVSRHGQSGDVEAAARARMALQNAEEDLQAQRAATPTGNGEHLAHDVPTSPSSAVSPARQPTLQASSVRQAKDQEWHKPLDEEAKKKTLLLVAGQRQEPARAQKVRVSPPSAATATSSSQSSVAASAASSQSSTSRQETGNRRDYWEPKVSREAKDVCRLLGIEWWDYMPHSSPHMTEGTGQGGKAGHEERDAAVMTELRRNVAAIVQQKYGIGVDLTWGDMLKYVKGSETKEEIDEKKATEKSAARTQAYTSQRAAQARSALIGDRELKATERNKKQVAERKAKDQGRRNLRKEFEDLVPKASPEDWEKYQLFRRVKGRAPTSLKEFNDFDQGKKK